MILRLSRHVWHWFHLADTFYSIFSLLLPSSCFAARCSGQTVLILKLAAMELFGMVLVFGYKWVEFMLDMSSLLYYCTVTLDR